MNANTVNAVLRKTLELVRNPSKFVIEYDCADEVGACFYPMAATRLSLRMALREAVHQTGCPESITYLDAMDAMHEHAPVQLRQSKPILTLAHLSHSHHTSHEIVLEVLKKAIIATTPSAPKKNFQVFTQVGTTFEAADEDDAIRQASALVSTHAKTFAREIIR